MLPQRTQSMLLLGWVAHCRKENSINNRRDFQYS